MRSEIFQRRTRDPVNMIENCLPPHRSGSTRVWAGAIRAAFVQIVLVAITLLTLARPSANAAEAAHTYRLRGLFQPDRVDDLRAAVGRLDGVKLGGASYAQGEATFVFDPEKVFPNVRFKSPEQLMTTFGQKLRQETRGTFEIIPRGTVPPEKLVEVRIPVLGLDCRGCSYGAYLAVIKVEGVEWAAASFKDGLVTARIDPDRTNRGALEAALEKARVTLADRKKE